MNGTILWNGAPVAFRAGESVASALARAGIRALGNLPTGQASAVFCGIGQCQGCLVLLDGRLVEACLTACRDGLSVEPAGADNG
jgi:aerobic-type carbon monoxide dehydrogenase small subunit (CoxS/CutS family)